VAEQGLLRPHYTKLLAIFRLLEGALVAVAFYLAWLTDSQPWALRHTLAALLGGVVFVLVAEARGLYRAWRGVPMRRQVGGVFATWGFVIPLLLLFGFLTKSLESFSRAQVAAWLLLTPVIVSASRVAVALALQELRQRGFNTRRVAFAGISPVAEQLARTISETPWSGMRIHGFYDDRIGGANDETVLVGTTRRTTTKANRRVHRISADAGSLRGNFEQLLEDARTGKVDIVYISLPLRADARINQLIAKLADTTASVHVVADLFVSNLLQARWTAVGDVPVLSVHETPFYGVNSFVKRVEDLVVGAAILGLITVPMAIIALAVKATSRGPAFFRQRRYGLGGEEIMVLKFRTMSVCEDGKTVKQATKNDARLTSIGAFLRRTSLDELPQFLNVLTGEMSIVGPRPHAVAHNEFYRSKIHGYMLRHKVKPGITGWAQVNGWRGETDTLEKMEKRVEHDLAYIRNWGLLFDLKIIFMTVFSKAVRKNAF